MKKMALAVVMGAMTLSSLVHANDGTVKFTGEVVDAPCIVNIDSLDQTIPLGQVKTSTFTAAGDVGAAQRFNIVLEQCDITTKGNANITFNGIADGDNGDLLGLDLGSGMAGGVGIQITAPGDNPLPINQATSDLPLKAGQNTISFQAAYVSSKDTVTPGKATASADFSVAYK